LRIPELRIYLNLEKKSKTNPPLIPSASPPQLPSPNVSPPTLISPSLPTTSPICPHEDTSHCNISNEDDDLEDTHDEVTNGATHDTFTNGPTDDAVTEVIEAAVTEVIEAAPVVIDLSFNFPKNKAKTFIVISKDKIQLSFRSGVDNFTNMVPQISKEILSNFSYKYQRRATNNRRTGRSISRRIQQSSDDTSTGNKTSSVM